ncbi:MAG: NAD-dependent epimerase/dehydratase family protein [Candidatus Limnocylindria bacterium]
MTAEEVRRADLAMVVRRLDGEFAEMAGSRLLVTGGAGFLGYYLVQAALAANDARRAEPILVTVWDSYMRGVPEWLVHLSARPDVEVAGHDVREPLPADTQPFDYIIHAAGIASPTYYRRHPLATMDANIDGLRSLLDFSVETRPRGFLFFSSSEIYGDPPPEAIPTPETYRGNVSCTGPRACYDESKRYGETLCVTFAQHYGVPISMARPFNNYGPGMKITDGRVIADFCRSIIDGDDIVMHSDGSPTRTFCYVADAIVGYYKVLVRGRPGEPYNIGTETPEISVSELAARVAAVGRELLGYGGRVIHRSSTEQAYLDDNPTRRSPSLTKSRAELGFEAEIGIDEGLRRTLAWYAGNRSGSEA